MYEYTAKLFYWACVLILAVNAGAVFYRVWTVNELKRELRFGSRRERRR